MTRKNRLERKERPSRNTSLEYSSVDGVTVKPHASKTEV
jgi:hypothetical protein